MAKSAKDVYLQIRVSAEEKSEIEAAAAELDMSMSEYMLQLARRRRGDPRCKRCRRVLEIVRAVESD